MHALKDYYGMVAMLEEFPQVRQTFNLVPSMIVQIEEYARGEARDPFLRCALKPAESLTADERLFLLKYFFQANPSRVIHRFPRYAELYETCRAAGFRPERLPRDFGASCYRDLQVLSQLAWFDEIFLEGDAEVRRLVAKGQDYTVEDQVLMGRKQTEILGKVVPAYRRLAASGQIELSFTPYYHPILPLLCDSSVANVSHPGVTLPRRFSYPDDARVQIETARNFMRERFGAEPAGMWPSEGSVSDQALALAADAGVRWMATDNGVLGATLCRMAGVEETYRPWQWERDGHRMSLVFRDRFLSDLVGFVYSRMDAHAAAHHLLDRVRENCRHLHDAGRDALVPIILDGENAWEHYDRNGRPFLRELYRLIDEDPGISAVTVSEALERVPSDPLDRIHPGSWINANFDIWIGAEEDNRAWELLLEAREAYDRVMTSPAGPRLPEERRRLAWEELMIAEGSDWCWWYGPEHHSENRPEFDKLFRAHLALVYASLGLPTPEALSRPILKISHPVMVVKPTAHIRPSVDGRLSSYFEWMGAGLYAPDKRLGAMHGGEAPIGEVRFASDGERLFLRVDFLPPTPGSMAGTELRVTIAGPAAEAEMRFALSQEGAERVVRAEDGQIRCAYERLFELSVPLAEFELNPSETLRFQISVWREGLPLDAAPMDGWIEFIPAQPADWE
jgi:alpha-amylase/alpha-mannosidase (GH57 family)